MQSPFAVWMDRFLLERPNELAPDEEDAQKQLIAGEGDKHERAYVDRLLSDGVELVEIDKRKDFAAAAADTIVAIRSKRPVIYQAALQAGNFAGFADFLVLDQHGEYEIRDTKLGRSPKPYYLMQLCCYAQLLAELTGTISAAISVVMVSGRERLRISGEPIELRQVRTADYWFYYVRLKDAFLKLMADFRPDMTLRPIPGARSDHGRWQSYADRWFEETDHLSRVARITAGQIKKLESAGIRTLAALANSGNDAVARLSDETRMKLVQQARIQMATHALRVVDPDTPPAFKVLPHRTGEARGLNALPTADPADVYFDMEGYPLVVGGLEYLFGACFHEGGHLLFRDWWAHSRTEEKAASEYGGRVPRDPTHATTLSSLNRSTPPLIKNRHRVVARVDVRGIVGIGVCDDSSAMLEGKPYLLLRAVSTFASNLIVRAVQMLPHLFSTLTAEGDR